LDFADKYPRKFVKGDEISDTMNIHGARFGDRAPQKNGRALDSRQKIAGMTGGKGATRASEASNGVIYGELTPPDKRVGFLASIGQV
jgi:hypothetical protein